MNTRQEAAPPTTNAPKRTVTRRRWCYSKVVLAVLLVVTIAGNAASYALAWRGYDAAEGVSTTLTTVFGAAVVGYLMKSLGEHASLNAHGITEVDEDADAQGDQ